MVGLRLGIWTAPEGVDADELLVTPTPAGG
jgi:hypothetical protein